MSIMAHCAQSQRRLSLHHHFSLPRCFISTEPASAKIVGTGRHARLNYRDISENVVSKMSNAINRKAPITSDGIQSVVRDWKKLSSMMIPLNAKRNMRSIQGEKIRKAAQEKDSEAQGAALEEGKRLKVDIHQMEAQVEELEGRLTDLALLIPNDTHPQSPLGPESAAITISTHGPEPLPASPSRDHQAICQALHLVDFETGAIVTGNSWYYLKNEAVLLEMALSNFAISMALKHGFTPTLTPDVVRGDIAKRCGFQPRDPQADHSKLPMYHISAEASSSAPELVLAATAEIPLAGMFANRMYAATALPLKLVGMSHSFRPEAGARGADTRGLYRVHQFTKVELFAVTTAEQSEAMMEEMKNLQILIYSALGFPFRVLDMPTEELGASAYRKYDIEAWMPGRGSWGEISSLSNCTDYQTRRLMVKYHQQTSERSQNYYAHTLNGTAAAIPRLIVALLENGAKFDEKNSIVGIELPEVLRPFWLDTDSKRNLIHWV